MTDNVEHLSDNDISTEQQLGEVALRPRNLNHLFAVNSEDVLALAPSVIAGERAFRTTYSAINPYEDAQTPEEGEIINGNNTAAHYLNKESPLDQQSQEPAINRSDFRSSRTKYGAIAAKMVQTGAQFAASFDTTEEAYHACRQVLPEESDEYLGNILTTRILPSAKALKDLRQVAQETVTELSAVSEGEAALPDRYTILKALSYASYESTDDTRSPEPNSLRPERMLSALYVMANGDLHKQLASEARAGVYDQLIAHDILWFLDGADSVEGDLAKVQQLVTFSRTLQGDREPVDKASFYGHMATVVGNWPDNQRQVIIEARRQLSERMERQLDLVTRALRQDDFIIDDSEKAFTASVSQFANTILRHTLITPENKSEIMRWRAKQKRGRKRQRKERPSPEVDTTSGEAANSPEPAQLVVCDLSDQSVTNDVDSMIDTFVTGVSQGYTTLRNDLKNMTTFMARRDLPPTRRRGVKTVRGVNVRFGTEEDPSKLWPLFEFKPTEAAGLTTRTAIAKDTRIYFINLDAKTIGIVGIKKRADQESFLRTIRTKTKERG